MKRVLKFLLRVIIVLMVVAMLVVASAAGFFYYTRWSKDQNEIVTYSGDKMIITSKKIVLEPCQTCLFLGVNGALTDFIMLGKYDPNTREVFAISIPRDTYVENSWDHKINSVYAKGYNPQNTIDEVEKITGVKADYYVVFKTKALREIVNAVDGVYVTVPFNMNYDDPYQDLYIHLKKGYQKLNGKQAEQFVRYRSGYANADLGRINTQQEFIKAMIKRCLEPQNLLKAKQLIQIGLDNVDTDVTPEIIAKYIDDAIAFKEDRVHMMVLPGEPGYVNKISYFMYDKEKTKEIMDEMFKLETSIEEVQEYLEQEESGQHYEITLPEPEVRKNFSGDEIHIEVLNNGTSAIYFNKAVEMLNEAGYKVVRVGNVDDDNQLSRVVSYVASQEALEILQEISEVVGITKMETDTNTNQGIDYTVILGPKYVAE